MQLAQEKEVTYNDEVVDKFEFIPVHFNDDWYELEDGLDEDWDYEYED